MKPLSYLAAALITTAIVGTTIAGGHAVATTCRADPLICTSTMPVGGYCECKASGTTIGGTVTATRAPEHYNSTAGGCSANSNDPGCRGLPMHDMPLQLQ